MNRLWIAAAIVLIVVSCGSSSGEGADAASSVETDQRSETDAPETTPTALPTDTEIDEPNPVVAFVAALDEALAETGYAGAVLDSPEVFVATVQLFCEQLEAGLKPDALLSEYVETLTETSIEQASDDDLVLAGSVLGIGVGTLCAEQSYLIDGSQ